jgi:site-specific DNA recombinase
VERQEADCRAAAERLGWDVVAVYVDNDISAYSGAPRPQYREMIDAVRAGQVQGVIAWHTDRLHRRATELEEFVTVAEAHNLQVQTVTAGSVDLSTASGRMIARMLGAAAQHEVDHARERMTRAKAQMALDGKYRGGPRPYGYEPGGMVVREREASVIREATKAILAGRTLAAVARDLNERGMKTSTNNEWTYARLKDVLVRPRNAGLLAHGLPGRETIRSSTTKKRYQMELIGPASWEPIITEDEWQALVATLTDPSRRRQDGNDTRWLGSGIYRCGICDSTLRPAPYGGTPKTPRERKYLYRCVASAHLTISTKETDQFVRNVVAHLVRDPRVLAAMHPADAELAATREQRAMIAARLARFESDYALGQITGAQLQKATGSVNDELALLDAKLAKSLRRSTSSAVMTAADPGEAFLAAPIDVQRAVLAMVLRVEVHRASIRGGAWSSDRLKITPVG